MPENEKPSGPERPQQKDAVTTWLEDRMKDATITVSEIPIKDARGWKIEQDQIVNRDQKNIPRFFRVLGLRISTSGREVDSFDQLGIAEVPDPSDPDKAVGTVGLLVDKETGDVLVTAVAEPMQAEPGEKPGNFLSLRPIQGSFTNLKENKVPLSEQIDPSEYTNLITLNAGRIRGKVRFGVTVVDKESIDLSKNANARWFSRKEIDQAINNGTAPFNAAFHTAYSIYKAKSDQALAA